MKQERYGNQSKILGEITASELQGQHVAQFNFCRYKRLSLQLKENSTAGVFHGILRKPTKSRTNDTLVSTSASIVLQKVRLVIHWSGLVYRLFYKN